jgi:hypothetical protein
MKRPVYVSYDPKFCILLGSSLPVAGYGLPSWNGVFPEKQKRPQLAEKFSAFHITQIFITVFISSHHSSPLLSQIYLVDVIINLAVSHTPGLL